MTRITAVSTLPLLLLSGVASAQSETWDCGSAFDFTREVDPLITVTLNDDLETGKLYVLGAGVEYDARYEMRGFDRWWSFGMNEDGTYAYGFLIQPSGTSHYYVLADETDLLGALIPREFYSCLNREEEARLVTR